VSSILAAVFERAGDFCCHRTRCWTWCLRPKRNGASGK
jgi:hypothetical protein